MAEVTEPDQITMAKPQHPGVYSAASSLLAQFDAICAVEAMCKILAEDPFLVNGMQSSIAVHPGASVVKMALVMPVASRSETSYRWRMDGFIGFTSAARSVQHHSQAQRSDY